MVALHTFYSEEFAINSRSFIHCLHSTSQVSTKMSAMVEEDENSNELQFGNINFDEVETLTNDEMYLLLAKRHNAGMSNE